MSRVVPEPNHAADERAHDSGEPQSMSGKRWEQTNRIVRIAIKEANQSINFRTREILI